DKTQSVARPCKAGYISDIGEFAVSIISVQSIASRNAAIVYIPSIDEIDVLTAVAIEIGHADSGAKFLTVNRDAIIALEVDELDASGSRHIYKLDSWQ